MLLYFSRFNICLWMESVCYRTLCASIKPVRSGFFLTRMPEIFKLQRICCNPENLMWDEECVQLKPRSCMSFKILSQPKSWYRSILFFRKTSSFKIQMPRSCNSAIEGIISGLWLLWFFFSKLRQINQLFWFENVFILEVNFFFKTRLIVIKGKSSLILHNKS